jgi:two-component system sensor kinase FixL
MNAGGIIQSASESIERVFGWTPNELFGRNVKLLIPEPRRSGLDRYLDRYRHTDQSKSLQKTGRFSAVRKDGSIIQIELSMSRADLPSHGAQYFIGIIREVSREIDVGIRPEVEQSKLHEFIAEQTRALATANLRLQMADRLASLGTLAAGLGHDMNNVLLPVRARLDALEKTGIKPTALSH